MDRIHTTVKLDFAENNSRRTVFAQQGDNNGRAVKIELYSNGERVTLFQSDTVTINASCNGVIVAEGVACQVIDNVVYVLLTNTLTALPGIAHCVLRVDGAQGRVHTARFDINIGADPASGATPAVLPTASIVDRVEELEDNCVRSTTVRQIVKITQDDYDSMAAHDANTLYCIVEDAPPAPPIMEES